MMSSPRTLLIIEDDDDTFLGLSKRFGDRGWAITRATDRLSALDRLQRRDIDAVTLDLGLPPAKGDTLRVGLPLAAAIRRKYPKIPILIITNLSVTARESKKLISRLLPLGVSVLYKRDLPERPAVSEVDVLEMICQGYFVLSPGAAEELPDAVPNRPDPLDQELWDVVRPLAEGRTYHEIAVKLGMRPGGVEGRRDRAIEALIEQEELEEFQTDTESLKNWYNENCTRYRRDEPWPPPRHPSDQV